VGTGVAAVKTWAVGVELLLPPVALVGVFARRVATGNGVGVGVTAPQLISPKIKLNNIINNKPFIPNTFPNILGFPLYFNTKIITKKGDKIALEVLNFAQ
jgi:hypothetical protein